MQAGVTRRRKTRRISAPVAGRAEDGPAMLPGRVVQQWLPGIVVNGRRP